MEEMEKAITAKTWSEFEWPEWVPGEIQEQVESFWLESWGRNPKQWLDSAVRCKAPKMGLEIRVKDFRDNLQSGRFIYAWNNVGRLITREGKIVYCGYSDFEVSRDCMWQKPQPQDYQDFTVSNLS